jgi:nuclear transport factor 2 (NTF2) superfamily protein
VAIRAPGVDKESAQMDVAAPGFQWDGALKIVQRAEDTFNRGGVDAILNRYAEDVIPIRWSSGNPEKASAERFLRARFARQNNYRLKKTLFMVAGLQDRGHLFRVLGRCADRLGDARAGR